MTNKVTTLYFLLKKNQQPCNIRLLQNTLTCTPHSLKIFYDISIIQSFQ